MDIREKYVQAAIKHANDWQVEVSDHIIDIIVSVMMTRDNVGYPGGSFVQSVVKNDLVGSICRADNDCLKHLKLIALANVNVFVR